MGMRSATPPPVSGTPGSFGSTLFRSTPDNKEPMRTPTKPQLPKFLVRSVVVRLD
jgi:hypothetical protein